MTQEQKQRFFERLGVDLEKRLTFNIYLPVIYNEDGLDSIEREYKEMFLALVQTARFLEANINYMPDYDKDFQIENRNLLAIILSVIEQASGKPWQEVREIYEECI